MKSDNPLYGLSSKDFSVVIPEEGSMFLQVLREKCGLLEILKVADDGRLVFYFYYKEVDQTPGVSEVELKDWINRQGTSVFIADGESQAYKNWERLIHSKQSSSVVLAITMINTIYRPQPKYFSLLMAAQHSGDSQVNSLASQILKQYTREKGYNRTLVRRIINFYFVRKEDPFNLYFDLNYFMYWRWMFQKDTMFNEGKVLYLSSKNIQLIDTEDCFQEILPKMDQLFIRLEDGAKLACIINALSKKPNLNGIDVFSDHDYYLEEEEMNYLNRPHLLMENFILPKIPKDAFIFDIVNSLDVRFDKELTFNDAFFPNVTTLALTGTKIDHLAVYSIFSALKELRISLKEQTNLPDFIYRCENLTKFEIQHTTVESILPKFQQLVSLKSIKLLSVNFLEFPTAFFLAPELEEITGLSEPADGNYRIPAQGIDSKIHTIIWKRKSLNKFPYALAALKQLKIMRITNSEITEIDDRIADFISLEELHLDYGRLDSIPESILLLPNVKIISFYKNNIISVSHKMSHAIIERGITLKLEGNPLRHLPEIPDDYQLEDHGRDSKQGWVTTDHRTNSSVFYDKVMTVFNGRFRIYEPVEGM